MNLWRGGSRRAWPGFAALIVATLLVALATPARAQLVSCLSIGVPVLPLTTCSVSTTHHETDIPDPTAAPSIATGNTALQGQLNQVLAGSNGTALLTTLNALGVLGAQGPPTKTSFGTTTTVTNLTTVGPGTVLEGPDQSLQRFIPAGSTNVDQNTHIESFFLISPGSQPLSGRGANWLTGDLYAAVQTPLLDDGFRFVDQLFGRLRGTSDGAAAPVATSFAPAYAALPGDASDTTTGTAILGDGWRSWAAGTGVFARVSGNANNFGFGYNTGSGAGGLERTVGPWTYGAAFSIGETALTQFTTRDNATIDSRRFAGYAAWQGMPVDLSAAVVYGNHDIGARRLTLLPGLATSARYGANSADAGLEVSRSYLWNAIDIRPMLGLVYDGLWTDRFVESGGSLLGLSAAGAQVNALNGYAGARVATTLVMPIGGEVTPEIRARVVHDFLNDRRGFTAAFTGDPTATPFTVAGLRPDRTAALVGAGVTAKLTAQWQVFVNYDADVRGNDVAHLVIGGVKLRW